MGKESKINVKKNKWKGLRKPALIHSYYYLNSHNIIHWFPLASILYDNSLSTAGIQQKNKSPQQIKLLEANPDTCFNMKFNR